MNKQLGFLICSPYKTRGKDQKDIDLIGSVTAEVIDRSRTTVLAIPENTPFKQFSEVKHIAFITNFDQRDLIAFETFFNTWKSFHFSLIQLLLLIFQLTKLRIFFFSLIC